MPVKKSKGRQKGILNGVQRHKLRSRPLVPYEFKDELSGKPALRFRKAIRKPAGLKRIATQWAERCFSLTSNICCTLCFTPFVKDARGNFAVASPWRRTINAVIMTLLCVTCVHKLVVTLMLFVNQDNTTTGNVLRDWFHAHAISVLRVTQ